MKRTATILLAVLGLLASACTDDVSTEAAGQLGSDAEVEADGADTSVDGADAEENSETPNNPDNGNGYDPVEGEPGDDEDDVALSETGTLRSAVLGRALDQSDAMTSARFEGVIDVDGMAGAELPGDLTMIFEGAYDTEADASEVTIDMSGLFAAAAAADPEAEGMGELFASMFEDPLQMITIGEKSWVKWGLLAMFGVEDKWLEGDADAGAAATDLGLGAGGNSPTSMLEELADADADVTEIGTEDIRGVSTTHFRAELDTAAMAATMSPEERADFESDVGVSPEGTYVIDLWIDDDDLLHRFVVVISGLEQDAELDSMTMTYDIWDHGLDQGIAPPPADQVVTEAELGFGLDDLGSLGG